MSVTPDELYQAMNRHAADLRENTAELRRVGSMLEKLIAIEPAKPKTHVEGALQALAPIVGEILTGKKKKGR